MKLIEIQDIHDFLKKVELWGSHTRIYRGVSNPEFELRPSVGRVEVRELPSSESLEDRQNRYEQSLLTEFKRRAIPFLRAMPASPMEWLCLAQHYGLPTRLLDWTNNPLVALYFACEQNASLSGAVYLRHQDTWWNNPYTIDPFDVPGGKLSAFRPNHSDPRLVNQDGVFTLHPNPRAALDDEHTRKLVFNASAKAKMQWQLSKLGIRPSLIYPGLEGVAKDAKEDCETTRTGNVREDQNPFATDV